MTEKMVQEAPYPDELVEIVEHCEYRPNWGVYLRKMDRENGVGLTLVIQSWGYDTYHPEKGESYQVNHYFPVPAASYNRETWIRWVFEQFKLVETHEAMEFFQIDRVRPYAPNHATGYDPYVLVEARVG